MTTDPTRAASPLCAQATDLTPDFALCDPEGTMRRLSERHGQVKSSASHPAHTTYTAASPHNALPLRLLAAKGRHITSQYGAHKLFPIRAMHAPSS